MPNDIRVPFEQESVVIVVGNSLENTATGDFSDLPNIFILNAFA